MAYLIEVKFKGSYRDRHGEHVCHDVAEIGIKGVSSVKYSQLYRIEGELKKEDAKRIAERLLIDPVTETYRISTDAEAEKSAGHRIEVWLKHGVTDTVADSVLKAVRDLGVEGDLKVKTGQKFVFEGNISSAAVKQVAEKLLANPMVQEYKVY